MEEEDDPIGFEVPAIEGSQTDTAVEEEENTLARSQVPTVEGTQIGTAADVTWGISSRPRGTPGGGEGCLTWHFYV